MKQPNTQRLRALRLSALARDNKVVNAIRASITQAPDALVKELMDVHGWPAHEALCAVQQLQQDVLDDTTRGAGEMECTQVNGLEEMPWSTSIGQSTR